ncbi:MAG: antitoxin family protein [Acidobacteriota bacterium]|nr:antitoxin family protein [Acidobacteriota bacterium]
MSQIVTAIYAEGVLRPLSPLKLPEQAEVEVEVKTKAKPSRAAIEERIRLHQALVDAGLVRDAGHWQAEIVMPVSEDEEEELGRVFAAGKPLSELILEEREERF